ncbi:hypothetical protein FRC12_003183 [Ceratobasidium sp. 428]|nr:hypothetical protein FRC12_003183 [Ceratobasidium sp. 428]
MNVSLYRLFYAQALKRNNCKADTSPDNEKINIDLQDVFSRWEKAYEQLASVLDTFSSEGAQLSSALKHPNACKWSGLERSLTYVDAAFASLNNCSSQVSNVRATLGTVHNQSRSLVPFSRLPDEVVVHILSHINANDPQVDLRYEPGSIDYKQPLFPLLSILTASKHLRHIAISTPSLWTYVYLFVEDLGDAYSQHIRRVLLYSQQLPLQVHVAGGVDNDEIIVKCLPRLLDSHAHRIASLDFQIPLACAWPVILDLFTNIPSCQVRELYINDPEAYPEQIDDTFPDRLLENKLDTFLQSLQVIGIRGFFIPLATPAYYGLTVLKVMPCEFRWSHPRLVELRNALAACPRLRSLALIECRFEFDSQSPVEPVLLPDLEILDLRLSTSTDELVALMVCINSGPNELAFSVSLDQDMSEDTMARLRCFIRQSNVTRLCLDVTMVDVADLNWLLALPQGETLAIQELALCSYNLKAASSNQPLSASRFPSLHTLHLMECEGVSAQNCRRTLDASAIQVLRSDYHPTIVREMRRLVPSVEYCQFSPSIAFGENDCEWPVFIFCIAWNQALCLAALGL